MSARRKPFPPNPLLMLCNCAGCNAEVIGPSTPVHIARFEAQHRPELRTFGGRIKGRPYCKGCLETHRPSGGRPAPRESNSPGWENGIRLLEGR